MLQKLLFALEVHFIMEDDKRPQTWHFMLSKSIKIIPGHLIPYPTVDINHAKVEPQPKDIFHIINVNDNS